MHLRCSIVLDLDLGAADDVAFPDRTETRIETKRTYRDAVAKHSARSGSVAVAGTRSHSRDKYSLGTLPPGHGFGADVRHARRRARRATSAQHRSHVLARGHPLT